MHQEPAWKPNQKAIYTSVALFIGHLWREKPTYMTFCSHNDHVIFHTSRLWELKKSVSIDEKSNLGWKG